MGISRRSTVRRNAARGAGGLLVAVAAAATLTACGDSGDDADELTVPVKNAAGEEIATAEFEFANGYVTVEVKTTQPGKLTPGFHGLHVHSVGLCQPNSTAPDGGEPGDFLSAGGHFQAPGHTGHPSSGDLSSLQVRNDGSALLETTTSSFTRADLEAGTGTSIMIHSGSDNFANIPAERYKQNDGTPGPDAKTMATGDAGSRVACGVISAGAQQ
ncbi:superoxide dismutase family protein [Gordonia alkaliphila]|uniref:superoxide dismutase[Cu-Zn] n=1 Tax=Gordonia alkaliphila TaxID=1053547 RepID=UPI001FF5B9A1|nr:superoxide dismutase family protein [Gordonia alkaliphila]MCK0440287.1 superoxide dismutase family protein [Gordonia alkaliphila]